MENSCDKKEGFKQEPQKRQKGGFLTIPFIIANEALEKAASFGLLPNMILYLMQDYNMELTHGQNIIFLWGAATNLLPLVGALLSDSHLGKFITIALGSLFTFLGMVILWLTAMIPQARPGPCDPQAQACKSTSTLQYLVLLSSFALMSVGAGGTRSCSMAFGADQLDDMDNPMNARMLERFFGWYYAAGAVALMLAFTGIVYIQDQFGWKWGFGIPALLMLLSASFFMLASSFYIKRQVKTNLLSSFIRVVVVSYKNRKLTLHSLDSNSSWYSLKDSEYHIPTDKLRFLNKACIFKNTDDKGSDAIAFNPWNVCTVDQVEELKTLIRVLPLWSTGIMMTIALNPGSFLLLQAKSMDRRLVGDYKVPAGSFVMFAIVTIFISIMLYDRFVIPLASKIRGKPVYLSTKERMGMGLLCSFMSMVVSAIVEHIRRGKAIKQGLNHNPSGLVDMSAYWLVPQLVLNGLAETSNLLAHTEFYYSEFPKSMSSIASAMFGLGIAFANLFASALMSTVNQATSEGGKDSWTSSNINKGHYDSYYWLLAIMSAVNLLYFFLCSWAYGPCVEQRIGVRPEEYIGSDKELLQMNKPQEKDDTGDTIEELI